MPASRAFDEAPQIALRDDRDVEAALERPEVLRARAPYLAHTTMEPMTATALFRDGQLTLWTGIQAPTIVRDRAAELAGLSPEAVAVHTTCLGGGFGRRAEYDVTNQAARIALAMPGAPVNLTWSREEDVRHDVYRPARSPGWPVFRARTGRSRCRPPSPRRR